MIKYFIIFIVLILPYPFVGQVNIHKHYTMEDGLIDNRILSMFQDSKGYLWLGTFNGISKWDGNNFINITKSDGLTSSAILDMLEMPDSTIIISTYGKGLVLYKNGIYDTLNTDDGLSSNMVIHLKMIDGKPIIFSDKIQTFVNGKFIDIQEKVGKLKGVIGDMLYGDNGEIYIAGKGGGFYVKENSFEKIFTEKDGLLSNRIYRIAKDKFGDILLATSKGPNKYTNGKIIPLHYNGTIIKGITTEVLAGSDSTNYYISEHGLIVERNNDVQLLTTENGLLDNAVGHILEDKNGTIYIGYDNYGMSVFYPKRFTNFFPKDNAYEFITNAIIQNTHSNIVLGSQTGITIIKNNSIIHYSTKNGLTNNNVLSLAKNHSGDIFIGTSRGFNILSGDKITPYYRDDRATQGIYDIEISPDGDAIMAVRRQGLLIFTPSKQKNKTFLSNFINTSDSLAIAKLKGREDQIFAGKKIKEEKVKNGIINHITLQNGLQSSWILDMLFTKDSTLVIGYHGKGVSFYKNGRFKHISKNDGLTDGIVTTIFHHKNGSFWFGTSQGGISIYNNGIIDTIDITDGLSSNDITGIAQVDDRIYVATQNGMNLLIKNKTGYFIRQINKTDGLPSNDCNRNALYVDDEKHLWIGTNKGLTKYNPKFDKPITTPPNIFISGLEIFNKPKDHIEFSKNPKLNYDQNYIKFIYTGIDLSAPEKIIYKYRLRGVDKEWVTSKENNVQYTSLNDGAYKFEVMARNDWGYWSKPAYLAFTISPAWWETWWFYSLIFIVIGSLIAFAASYRYRNLLAIEKIRTKISADLHDSIGSGLSEITILSELLAIQRDPHITDMQNGLKKISSTARSLVGDMSDIVWLVNPSKDSLRGLLLRLQDSYHEVLSHANISFDIKNIERLENIHLPMTFRQHLFLLFKEAINNALKYSACTILILNVNLRNKFIVLSLNDNGKGFNIKTQKYGNGIKNMTERANSLGGTLEITSKIDEGTTIKFSGRID